MDSLPVIPTPRAQRWREFRVRIVPFLTFAITFVAVVFLWRSHVLPPTTVGEVTTEKAEVISPDNGYLTNLHVVRFQHVNEGDVIAEIVSTESRRIDAQIDLLRGQIALSQLQINTMVDRERLAFDYYNLRVEYFRQRVELVTAQAELEPAERDYRLALALKEQDILSTPEVAYFARSYLPLKAKVEEVSKVVQELEGRLEELKSYGKSLYTSGTADNLNQALADLEKQRVELEKMQREPVVLTAPISGTVTMVYRTQGEAVIAGEPIVTIKSDKPTQIHGYLRQPLSFSPKPGMRVKVRVRSALREEVESQIAAVAGQFEVVTNLALLRPGVPVEVGLGFLVDVPPSLAERIRPGELVDLTLED